MAEVTIKGKALIKDITNDQTYDPSVGEVYVKQNGEYGGGELTVKLSDKNKIEVKKLTCFFKRNSGNIYTVDDGEHPFVGPAYFTFNGHTIIVTVEDGFVPHGGNPSTG